MIEDQQNILPKPKHELRMDMIALLQRLPKQNAIALALVLVLLVALADFYTGYEISFSIFYLSAIVLSTWFVGKWFAQFISVLSVVSWLIGDLAAGAVYSAKFVPAWNAVIMLCFYTVMVRILSSLRSLHDELEAKVKERTMALTNEMATRERLEKELLAVSEREQRRIGHDLHDGLCQHLTASALAAQVLGERLDAQDLPEAIDAGRIVNMIEEAIGQTRDLARGLFPVRLEADGLVAALHELAGNLSKRFRTCCVFESKPPSLDVNDAAAAVHFYRIAQEAAMNAIKHGHAKHISIVLMTNAGKLTLGISDDGAGLPENWRASNGMGIHIMAHRALMIGGEFFVQREANGGTLVQCTVKLETLTLSVITDAFPDESIV